MADQFVELLNKIEGLTNESREKLAQLASGVRSVNEEIHKMSAAGENVEKLKQQKAGLTEEFNKLIGKLPEFQQFTLKNFLFPYFL